MKYQEAFFGKKKWKAFLLAFSVCFVGLQAAFAGAVDRKPSLTLEEAAKRLQKQYEDTNSLTATFSQVTSSKISGRTKEGYGRLSLLKPGLMRWDYNKPDRQIIVCDGTSISMYFEKENQMIVSSAKEYLESDITYSFFAGKGNLLKDFDIEKPDLEVVESRIDEMVLRLRPKKRHPQIEYILVWTDQRYLVNKLMIIDTFGSVTDITFDNLQVNQPVDKKIFHYTPPKNTEILTQ